MDDQRTLLARAAAQGLTLRMDWVREWTKRPGQRRGRYRRTLKYYWMQANPSGETLLHSGPFYSQAEALRYLANLFTKD